MKAFDKNDKALEVIKTCLEKDPAKTVSDSYVKIYKRLRDGDLATR